MKNLIAAVLLLAACADTEPTTRDIAAAWCARADECAPGGESVGECTDRLARVIDGRDIDADACLESIADAGCGDPNAGWGPACWSVLDVTGDRM